MLLPYMKNKKPFLNLQRNGFFSKLNEEAIFQFFVVQILRQNNFTVVVNEKSGKRSYFEQYLYKAVGNIAGVPDIFVWDQKYKGFYFELKKSKSTLFRKNGDFKKFTDTIKRQFEFLEKAKKNDFIAEFLYPENFKIIFKEYFNITV